MAAPTPAPYPGAPGAVYNPTLRKWVMPPAGSGATTAKAPSYQPPPKVYVPSGPGNPANPVAQGTVKPMTPSPGTTNYMPGVPTAAQILIQKPAATIPSGLSWLTSPNSRLTGDSIYDQNQAAATASANDPIGQLLSKIMSGMNQPPPTYKEYSAPTLESKDLSYLYNQFAPGISGAYDQLSNLLSGQKTQQAADLATLRNQLAGSFGQARTDYNTANQAAANQLKGYTERLGIQDAYGGPAVNDLAQQTTRYNALADQMQNTQLNMMDVLANARNSGFDTLLSAAASSRASGLQGLAQQLAGSQADLELERMKSQGQLGSQALQSSIDLAKLGQSQQDTQMDRMLKLLGILVPSGGLSGTSGTGNTTVEDTSTQLNPGLWSAITNYPDDAIRQLAMDAYMSGENDPNAAIKNIYEMAKLNTGTKTPENPAGNYISPDIIDSLLQIFYPYASGYGGYGRRVTEGEKAKGNL